MKIYIGTDNGYSGAIAALKEDGDVILVEPFKIIKAGKTTRLDTIWLRDLLRRFRDESGGSLIICAEQAQKFSPGKMALCSTWHCWGMFESVLSLESIPYQPVDPKKWQTVMFAGIPRGKDSDTKAISVEVCRRLYPSVPLLPTPRCSVPDSGMADALLIATYAKRANL